MNSSVCVDASLILRTLIPAPYSPQALDLLSQWQQQQTKLIAPTLLPFEVTSVLRRLVFLKELRAEDGEAAFDAFRKIKIRFSARAALFPLAWKLVKEFNRPRAYDVTYLALAQLEGVELWTADERLYNAVKGKLAWVRWVGEYSGNLQEKR
jgi:predicted nucleic acid-binding protein